MDAGIDRTHIGSGHHILEHIRKNGTGPLKDQGKSIE
jgi:hypothetical protein